MTLVLSSQLESLLVLEARRKGLTPDAYAELLLRNALPVTSDSQQESSDDAPASDSESRPRFGSAKGMITLSEDFDAPLEDFQEYMH